MIKSNCSFCGKEYLARPYQVKHNKRLFCSPACFHAAYVKKNLIRCAMCGKEFYREPSRVKDTNYCSQACAGLATSSRQRLTTPYFYERHPGCLPVWHKVHDATKRGKLKPQPCELCGTSPAVAHHNDYNKPFDIQWLCRPCHYQVHKKAHIIYADNEAENNK